MTKFTNVSKRMLALFMSLLMMFSCMAISASATGEEGTTPETPAIDETKLDFTKLTAEFNEADRKITVNYAAGVWYDGKQEYNIVDFDCPGASRMAGSEENTLVFYNLDFGQTYKVTATVTIGKDSYSKEIFTQKIKNQQSTPENLVAEKITSDSIIVKAAAGSQYIILKADGSDVGYDWTDSKGNASILFDGLEAETAYVIKAKRPASETAYESKTIEITVKTNKAGVTDVPSIGVKNKSNKAIVVEVKNPTGAKVEFSLDGKAWQDSPEFSGLKANTQYQIYARYAFSSNQDPSAVSEPIVVKTNEKASFEASEKKITFTLTENTYATSVKFSVKGDGPANMNEAAYGDTRIIPVSYKVVYGNESVKGATAFEGAKISQTGSFSADNYAEKTVDVIVTYAVEEYKGVDENNKPVWSAVEGKEDGISTKTQVKLGRVNNTETKIKEFFEKILNFLLNTVPAFIKNAMTSDIWNRILKLIGDLGKVIG